MPYNQFPKNCGSIKKPNLYACPRFMSLVDEDIDSPSNNVE